MSDFTAADVGKLRETTGAGLMDCKKALVEAKGNLEAAVDILRKRGGQLAVKKATRETKEGVEYEDWIYGTPPGRVTFVTFVGAKVVKVKETYAGLGGSIAETPKQ